MNSVETERQFTACSKQAGHTEVKNASLVLVRCVTHVIGNAALFLPSYVFFTYICHCQAFDVTWRDVTWRDVTWRDLNKQQQVSACPWHSAVHLSLCVELKTLFVVLLLVDGNGRWPTGQTHCRPTAWCLTVTKIHCLMSTRYVVWGTGGGHTERDRSVDGLSPLRRGFSLRGRETLGQICVVVRLLPLSGVAQSVQWLSYGLDGPGIEFQ